MKRGIVGVGSNNRGTCTERCKFARTQPRSYNQHPSQPSAFAGIHSTTVLTPLSYDVTMSVGYPLRRNYKLAVQAKNHLQQPFRPLYLIAVQAQIWDSRSSLILVSHSGNKRRQPFRPSYLTAVQAKCVLPFRLKYFVAVQGNRLLQQFSQNIDSRSGDNCGYPFRLKSVKPKFLLAAQTTSSKDHVITFLAQRSRSWKSGQNKHKKTNSGHTSVCFKRFPVDNGI